jgi:hypothetical protein
LVGRVVSWKEGSVRGPVVTRLCSLVLFIRYVLDVLFRGRESLSRAVVVSVSECVNRVESGSSDRSRDEQFMSGIGCDRSLIVGANG